MAELGYATWSWIIDLPSCMGPSVASSSSTLVVSVADNRAEKRIREFHRANDEDQRENKATLHVQMTSTAMIISLPFSHGLDRRYIKWLPESQAKIDATTSRS